MTNEHLANAVLISLVGEQPAPNLVPLRHLKPAQVVWVGTERSQRVCEHLQPLTGGIRSDFCKVHPYDLAQIREVLRQFVGKNEIPPTALVFNLTGGTKPMAFAALGLAQEWRAPMVYLQTEGETSRLYYYAFSDRGALVFDKEEQVPESITLDDHLKMYLGAYREEGVHEPFEKAVVATLQSAMDQGISEVKAGIRPVGALEIDVVVRCGNQIGVGEIKHKSGKDGIDQLNSVASQRYLGTYVTKVLILANPLEKNNAELAEAYRITPVVLASGSGGELSAQDQATLIHTVLTKLGVRR